MPRWLRWSIYQHRIVCIWPECKYSFAKSLLKVSLVSFLWDLTRWISLSSRIMITTFFLLNKSDIKTFLVVIRKRCIQRGQQIAKLIAGVSINYSALSFSLAINEKNTLWIPWTQLKQIHPSNFNRRSTILRPIRNYMSTLTERCHRHTALYFDKEKKNEKMQTDKKLPPVEQ